MFAPITGNRDAAIGEGLTAMLGRCGRVAELDEGEREAGVCGPIGGVDGKRGVEVLSGRGDLALLHKEVAEIRAAGEVAGLSCDRAEVEGVGFVAAVGGEQHISEVVQSGDVVGIEREHAAIDPFGLRGFANGVEEAGLLVEEIGSVGRLLKVALDCGEELAGDRLAERVEVG